MEIKMTDKNKDTYPLFTVIIPVKNRAKYLYHTLRTCMMQNYDNLEVIVSDDGSTDNTREVVEDASRIDSRIRYVSQGAGVGMRENFEIVLRQVKPGFVIALGGDDGLLPDGIKGMHDILHDTGMDLLAWPAPLYSYPNVTGPNGQLSIYHKRGIKIVDSHEFLNRQAKNLHYLSDIESPMFYVKGVASTKLIDRVRSRSPDGRFYSCPTPDGYSGIVLAGEVSRYAFSGKPFSIFGMSPTSQGLGYLSNDEKAKKASETFFQDVSLKSMHPELASQPYSPLITLMTVDYLLTARDLPGWTGSFQPINYREVLLKGLKELAHGLYGEERICRELKILNEIAEKHGFGEFFRGKVLRAKRYRKRTPFEGNGINTDGFLLDGKLYNLCNIFDAAHAAKNIYQVYSDLKPSSIVNIISKSLIYRFRALGKGSLFPPDSEWGRNSFEMRQTNNALKREE
jgi:glycosyltransferase involved in cell wall biosynthesis